jgi:hypothetical protein
MTKQLDEIFDIDPALTPDTAALTVTSTETLAPIETTTPLADLDTDVAYARANITGAVNKVKEAMDSAILLAQSGDSPRAFE